MLKNLLRGLLSAIAIRLIGNYRRLSVRLLRIEAARGYLHGVRLARLSALGLMGMGLLIGLVCLGAVLFHVGLFILLPWGVSAKAVFGMFLGMVYIVLGGLALRAGMNERTWMDKSGATEMLEDAMGRGDKNKDGLT